MQTQKFLLVPIPFCTTKNVLRIINEDRLLGLYLSSPSQISQT